MSIPLIGQAVAGVMQGLDSLITSKEEKMALELALTKELNQPHLLQALANIEEAKHPNMFVSGWRPALGWLTAFCLGYAWILRDFMVIVIKMTPKAELVSSLPVIETADLMTLVFALLGLGGVRAYEKVKGVARSK
jgi:hypothetical protein